MSKLPNAPLQEVIFELKWDLKSQSDLINYQYLHGDLFNSLKSNFPFRESLTPPEIPLGALLKTITHRFRKVEKGYPLIQLGPGILTINTVDKLYFWDDYFIMCGEIIDSFFNTYTTTSKFNFTPALTYVDFFEVDYSVYDAFKFLNENFNVSIAQNFYKSKSYPSTLNFGFKYENEIGMLALNFNTGKKSGTLGIVCNTQILGPSFGSKASEISTWLEKAHTICRELFVKMTKESFYESFK